MTQNKRYSSSQLAEKKKRKKRIRRLVFVTLVLALLLGISFWSGHQSVTINEIKVSNNQYLNDSELILEVEELISKRYFHLFSKKNFLIMPRGQILELVFENISVSDARLSLDGRNSLLIEIKEHEPVAKWCGPFEDQFLDNCYLISRDGLIYAQEDKFNPEDIFIAYGVFETEEAIIGKYFIDTEYFRKVIAFVVGLDDLEIEVLSFGTVDDETFAIHTSRGPYLLISIHNQAEDTLNNLKTVIEMEEINRAQFRNLEYIDLRFGNRVYYQIR